MDYIQLGLAKGLFTLNEETNRIKYLPQNKSYSFKDPEERVRAAAYVQLVEDYGYAPKRIAIEREVQMGVAKKSADIIVFGDDAHTAPYIIVECKKEEASDAEYNLGVDEGFSYAVALNAAYLWVTSNILNSYYDIARFASLERDKNQIADIPRYGATALKKARFYKGGVDENGDKAFEIQEISQSELTRRFKQAHDALWAGGKRVQSEAFDELNKLIFCKIWDEKKKRRPGDSYNFQVFADETDGIATAARIKAIYAEGKERDPEVFKDDIGLTPQELKRVVGYLASIHLEKTDLDSKGRAFEEFLKDDIFRGKAGQFFTPRNVVEFVVSVLPIDNEDLVIDPSCGSSGFLLYVLDKIRKQASEWHDIVKEESKHYQFWHKFAQKNLFGIEISNKISRVAKMNMIIHDDGHTNVVSFDGLEPIEKIRLHAQNNGSESFRSFSLNTFDYIVTNPPFGSVIKAEGKSYIGDYDLGKKNFDWIEARLTDFPFDAKRDSQKSEILFIEQCHKFLKPDGFLAIVLPDGILTNSSLQYVRDWIEEHFRIVAVVSLPQTAFTHTGAGVKSSVLFARKYDERTTEAHRALKHSLQDDLFAQDRFSGEINRLLNDKQAALRKGDLFTQDLNESLVNHLDALREQGTLDAATKRQLERETKDKIKEHQQTDAYKEWRQQANDDFNERLATVKEALSEEFLARARKKLANYPIFMAIAHEIGYDATGRETRRNELDDIGAELKKFIQAVIQGQDSFFASAPL